MRSSPAHVHAGAVGQHQVEHDGVRRPGGRRRQRLLGGRRPRDLVPGAAQVGGERAQDLRLVVDHQDQAALGHCGASSAGRKGEREAGALAGARLRPQAAAVCLGEPAGDRQAEARCRSDPAPARRGRTARTRARARSRAGRGPGRSRARSPPCGCGSPARSPGCPPART